MKFIRQAALAIFSAYRKDDFADGGGFLVQLGVVLEGYTDDVVRYVASPRTGIVRTAKFVPTIAEIVTACDTAAARIDKLKHYDQLPQLRRLTYEHPTRVQGRRANVHVLREAPQYEAMVKLSEKLPIEDWRWDESDGIWIALNRFEAPRVTGDFKPIDPIDITPSPALAETLANQRRARADVAPPPHWSDLGS